MEREVDCPAGVLKALLADVPRVALLSLAHVAECFAQAGLSGRGEADELGAAVGRATGLSFPTAMMFAPGGALYVSNKGFGFPPGAGEIVRVAVSGDSMVTEDLTFGLFV